MFRKIVASVGLAALVGGALVGCGSAEEQRALEEAKAIQEQIRQEKYCEAVTEIAGAGHNRSWILLPSGQEAFYDSAVQMSENAPPEDQEKLRSSVNKMLAWHDYLKMNLSQDGLWEDVKGVARSLTVESLLDHPYGQSIEDLIDYASSNRCNTAKWVLSP